ncbi:MAG: HD domain-containing protein [Spirochaetes bacterium]|nr:MAG: HD domain-containing protein [Spirochaetota bacterium]
MQHIDQWLSTTLKCIGDAVITTDRDRLVTFMNYAGENLTGWTNEEALGKDLIKLFTIINEDTRAIIDDPVVKVLSDGSTVENESSIMVSREGHDIAISFNASPVQDENGNNTGVVFVFRDITSKKKAEDVSRKTLQKLRNAMNAIIEAMVFTVETRDPYTAGHQKRVANLARAIAKELWLTDDQIDGIRMAGVIHDLGKISIPAEILSRPGKLLPLEYGLIKTHAQVGYDILKNIEFPWPVAEIVHQHHEKIDGSGYPQGLQGEQIHKESRVIAVADVVEAMASHRPYRAALGIDKSLEEITANRGSLYDGDSVDACVILFTRKDFKL